MLFRCRRFSATFKRNILGHRSYTADCRYNKTCGQSQKIRDAGWRLLFFGAEPAAGIETSSGLRTPAKVSKPGATVRWTVALVRIDSHCILPPRWRQYAVRPRFCLRQNTCNAPLGAASLHPISPDIEPTFAGCEGWLIYKKSHRVRGAAAPRKRSNPFFAAACTPQKTLCA